MLDQRIGCHRATPKDHLDQVDVETEVEDGRPGATDREVDQVVEVAEGLRRRVRRKMEKRRGSGRDGRRKMGTEHRRKYMREIEKQ